MTHLPNGAPIAAIPEALRQVDQWVLWRLDPKDEKPEELTKVPYRDVDRKAKANNPKTWHLRCGCISMVSQSERLGRHPL
jgi:primase-polymerase (primpol)-like protein